MTSTTKVFLSGCTAYSLDAVEECVRRAFAEFGGVEKYRGKNVLIKPNLLAAHPVEKAVTTHPVVVEGVIRTLKDAGTKHITLGDSPGIGRATSIAEKTGIGETARKYGVEVVEFDESVVVQTSDANLYKRIEVARQAIEADEIINLPKFKTHGQMMLTVAVKNLFGCVVGHRKAQWHMAAGDDYDAFARVLLELSDALPPVFSIVDGIIGMDGKGPSAGRARPLNLLLAGDDAFAVDCIAARLAGVKADDFPLMRAAKNMPHHARIVDKIEVAGDPVDELAPSDFELPARAGLPFGPPFIHKLLKRSFAARPHIIRSACKTCGICVEHCPPQAMTIAGGRVRIDYDRCISCFCCQEMCPEKAVDIRRGWLARLVIKR